jgi:hypothetical protein
LERRKKRGLSVLLLAAVVLVGTLVVAPAASAWTVTMNANPSFKRTYNWEIEKSVSQSSVTLAEGETAEVTYSVTVKSTGFTDSDWGVSGNVHMTAGDDDITVATLGVTIQPDDLAAAVNCVPPLPVNLGGGALDCGYSASLPNGNPRTALMRATTVDGGSRVVQTPFDFTNAAMTEIDECVVVTDSQAGTLGTVCVGDAPKTFTYTKTIGPYSECGPRTIDNTAVFTTNDTGATGSADAQVDVDVVCRPPGDEGCTPGFWKNHPEAWVGFTPGQTLESVFDVPNALGLDTVGLQAALDFGGGSGTVGASRILLRAAVAAVLNSASPGVDYPLTTAAVIAQVNAALASADRDTILALATELDTSNNLGCPL